MEFYASPILKLENIEVEYLPHHSTITTVSGKGLTRSKTQVVKLAESSLPIFKDFHLEMELGGVFFISGERQSGKTTLARIISKVRLAPNPNAPWHGYFGPGTTEIVKIAGFPKIIWPSSCSS